MGEGPSLPVSIIVLGALGQGAIAEDVVSGRELADDLAIVRASPWLGVESGRMARMMTLSPHVLVGDRIHLGRLTICLERWPRCDRRPRADLRAPKP